MHQIFDIDLLSSTLQQCFETTFIGSNGNKKSEINELKNLIFRLRNDFKNLIIIVDDISETKQNDRKLILSFLKNIRQFQTVIKLFIISRSKVNASVSFNDSRFSHINIRPHDLQSEISNFVDLLVDEAARNRFLAVCGPNLIDEIKKVLKIKVNEMCDTVS